MGDGAGEDLVGVAVGVGGWVHGDGEGFFGINGVLVAVDGGVEADREKVLVVLGEGAGGDDVAPGRSFGSVDVDDGDDAGGADFDGEAGGLVESVGEDVFVVGEGDDELDN